MGYTTHFQYFQKNMVVVCYWVYKIIHDFFPGLEVPPTSCQGPCAPPPPLPPLLRCWRHRWRVASGCGVWMVLPILHFCQAAHRCHGPRILLALHISIKKRGSLAPCNIQGGSWCVWKIGHAAGTPDLGELSELSCSSPWKLPFWVSRYPLYWDRAMFSED